MKKMLRSVIVLTMLFLIITNPVLAEAPNIYVDPLTLELQKLLETETVISGKKGSVDLTNPDILSKGWSQGKVVETLTQKMINVKDVYIPEDGKTVKNTVKYRQNLDEPRSFRLIILADYIQTGFFVDGVRYNTYPFDLLEEDSIDINVEININGRDIDELDYIIIKDPDYNQIKQKEEEVKKRAYLSYISSYMFIKVRLKEASTKLSSIKFENDWVQTFEEDLSLDTAHLIKDREIEPLEDRDDFEIIEHYFQPAYEVESEETYSLIINNFRNWDMEFVILQLLDWNQIPFEDGQTLKYVDLKAKSFEQYRIKLPYTNTEGIYAIFAFEKPFSNITGEVPPTVSSSERAIIRPK